MLKTKSMRCASWMFVILVWVGAQTLVAGTVAEKYGENALAGVWANEEKTVKVKIERIGRKFFGKIVWLEKNHFADGSIKTDKYNPDPALRATPFIGLRTVRDMEYEGNDTWGGGTLYDPESGKTYGCRITLTNYNLALIRGYVGLRLLGKTVRFERVVS
jgi:uncharacterized protein (DUF2147 family)